MIFICLHGCLLRLLGVYVLRLVFLGVCCVVFVLFLISCILVV